MTRIVRGQRALRQPSAQDKHHVQTAVIHLDQQGFDFNIRLDIVRLLSWAGVVSFGIAFWLMVL